MEGFLGGEVLVLIYGTGEVFRRDGDGAGWAEAWRDLGISNLLGHLPLALSTCPNIIRRADLNTIAIPSSSSVLGASFSARTATKTRMAASDHISLLCATAPEQSPRHLANSLNQPSFRYTLCISEASATMATAYQT